jgi:hypothetical protein
MTETFIVRTGDGFGTYSGWVIARTSDVMTVAVVAGPRSEPSAMLIPMSHVVAGTRSGG